MDGMFIGEYIRDKRKEMGFSQNKFCEDICVSETMSRFERGLLRLSPEKIRIMLQKLNLPEHYAYLPSKDEIVIDGLKMDIVSCNVHHDKEAGFKKLEELEKYAQNDKSVRQFITRSRVLLGKPDGDYSFDEKLQMLTDAILLTSPKFDIAKIRDGIYALEEIKIINQIGLIYSQAGKHKKAVDIFSQLLEYIKEHYNNVHQAGGTFPMVAYNLALELSKISCYEEALETAQLAWDSCIHYGHYQFLPGSIVVMAKCYHFLGDDEKSRIFYHRAYTLYFALGDERNAQNAKESAMEYLNEELVY